MIEQINKEVARVLMLPEVAKQLLTQGAEHKASTSGEFTNFVRDKIDTARVVANSAGIRVE